MNSRVMEDQARGRMTMESYVECSICGFGYLSDDMATVQRHDTFHDSNVHGALIGHSDLDRVVGQIQGLDVLESAMDLPIEYRRHIATVAYRAQRDTPDFPTAYDGGPEDVEWDGRAFVVRSHDRGVALAVMRKRSPSVWVRWVDYAGRSQNRGDPIDSLRWTVDRVWVLEHFRSRKIARTLLDLISGHLRTPITQFGWVPEFTPSGEKLVRSLSTAGFWAA